MTDGIRHLSDPSLPWPYDEKILADLEGGGSELNRLRALRAQAEYSLDAIENLCALNPRLADGEIHQTAMSALAAIREGR